VDDEKDERKIQTLQNIAEKQESSQNEEKWN
jgi:hypothetical protein